MRKIIFTACLLLFTACVLYPPMPCFADESKGAVNWVGGYISGFGQATATPSGNKTKDRLKALRAAEVLALRSLAETIRGVRIDGDTVVENMMLRDDIVRARVEGIVKGAQKVRADVVWEDNAPLATVEMRICMTLNAPECRSGSSLMSILPVERKKEPAFVPTKSFIEAPAPEKKEVQPVKESPKPEPVKEMPKVKVVSYDSSKPVTGVVFNLEGQPFEREMLPVVVTTGEDNSYLTVYSAKSVKPNVIRTYGVVRYSDNLDQAFKNPQLGNNVMTISAISVTKENMLLIKLEGAKALKETTRYGNDYLGDAKVFISAQ
ncbi:MAG: hypothetical protein EPN22_05970 [Nitrospirae bacterium]|nr:MAG: hypothetical protein EPN22_05970 [Nitrospirota bacterium]